MSDMVRLLRFAIGLVLVVAGVAAAGPYVAELAAAHGRSRTLAPPPETTAWVRQAACQASPPTAAPMFHDAGPMPVNAGPTSPALPPEEPLGSPSAPFLPRSEYRPPEPPGPMPPVAPDASRPAPTFAIAYRSTLDAPPPPLLDADAPPPLAVAWSANDSAQPGGRVATGSPPEASATYTVRDGDDLTGIALKVYGHAGGAQAIWSVNRDRLTNPNLLPIGLELRIPPAWSVPAAHQPAQAGQIEPARRPARVRVAPGETLESLAQRFYGDRAMAAQLFEANRDLLRNPALLVAGMELRLP